MTQDILITTQGRAGRITLNRPDALNALSYEMCLAIEDALLAWRHDPNVALVIIEGAGERAFCAGGDISEMYRTGISGEYDYGRQFWRDEYRLNAFMASYPKPIVSFLHGFTMGGGVGVGCHGSNRIVCETSQIAMPECGIGLVPDVGGTYLLASAPGRLGEYLGLTATRMKSGDAIYAGFADRFVPQDKWELLKAALITTGDVAAIEEYSAPAPESELAKQQDQINRYFGGERLGDILNSFAAMPSDFADASLKVLKRNDPLAMGATLEILHRLRMGTPTIEKALELEYRFTHRAHEDGDFLEGIRAAIIDKDRNPQWTRKLEALPLVDVSKMLRPIPGIKLQFHQEETAMKIGFIGLGNMGGHMARNLASAGHEVTGFDTAGVTIKGVTNAESAAAAAAGKDVVITMLPNGAILRAVADEILPVMSAGAVFADCSTVDVDSARAVAEQAQALGVMPVDAPVSGGVGGADAGTLTFMVGGSAEAFEKTKPLFDIMGQKAVHCGPSGNGQAAKICNNMILGVTMIATCEAFALADKLGLDRQAMFDVVSTSSGASWSINAYCPAPGVGPTSPSDNDYKPGFAAELMLKDLRLSQDAATSADADTPMGQLAAEQYRQFVEDEGGQGRDFSAMLPRFVSRRRS